MSVLETPRLLFRGQITWDPIVTNNQPNWYDENTARTVFQNRQDVAQYRKQSIGDVTTQGNWNPDGTHRAIFFNTNVIGVDVGHGPETNDPIVGAPVTFTGMLVDAEPYGSFSSQLFFDKMSFGINGGCQIALQRSERMTARYINFSRNAGYHFTAGGASVVWQSSFSRSNNHFKINNAQFSPVLRKFNEMIAADPKIIGLTVRWVAYRTLYYDSLDVSQIPKLAQQLQSNLNGGGFQPNPTRSEIVGVLGLMRDGEPPSEPGDRALLPATWTGQKQNPIAAAHVRLVGNSLVFDLSNSMPEKDIALEKQDFGDLNVVLVNGQSVVAPLGRIGYEQYNKAAYERNAGIVTLPIDPYWAMMAAFCDIQVRLSDNTVVLSEMAMRAIPMAPNIYINEGELSTVNAQVFDRGRPVGAGVRVGLGPPSSLTTADTRITDGRGVVSFPIRGVTGQVEQYVFSTSSAPPPISLDPQQTTYVFVRTLPLDADVGALPPTWANVHGHVLKNWQALAPCMDNWLNLGDPKQVKAFGPLLKKLTATGNFESFLYMPVTRDMTVGGRTLLYKFLDSPDADESLVATQDVLNRPKTPRSMSRAMRQEA